MSPDIAIMSTDITVILADYIPVLTEITLILFKFVKFLIEKIMKSQGDL